MTKLFDLAPEVHKNNILVILVQIDEAHSSAWPMAIDKSLGVIQPEPQKTFEDRLDRANHFVETYNPPYPVFVDYWNNDFGELFKAWPDKYTCANSELQLVAKADYHHDDAKEATVIEDCTDVLKRLMK
jgi:hypothetical protein